MNKASDLKVQLVHQVFPVSMVNQVVLVEPVCLDVSVPLVV